MNCKIINKAEEAMGLAVIIDVFRAFTLEPYVINNGASKLIPVGDIEIAKSFKEKDNKCILIGERNGIKLEGFDYGNSPSKIADVDFTGKTVALFGTGDQVGYPDTFLDGMGMLYETFQYRGAKFIGFWPTQGYDFTSPLPLLDHDHFVGLAIDEDNQPELTDERIKEWCKMIKPELGL